MGIFKPAWMTLNTVRAMKAVDKVDDDQKLYDISTQAPDRQVRLAAMEKIHDEKLLYDISTRAPDRQVRLAAMNKIHDERLLYKIANDTFHFSENERATAVKGIKDSKLLLDLAQNAKTIQHFGGLSQSVKEHGAYGCVKTAAIAQIDSEEMLETIADTDDCDTHDLNAGTHGYHNFQSYVIKTAIDKMKDVDRLKRLAMSGCSYTTCKYAVERLFQLKVEPDILEDIARNSSKYDARKQAMTALLGKGFMFDKELVQELTDQDFLYDFAKNQPDMGSGFNDYDRAAAVRKLTDPARVSEFTGFNNGEVRQAAADRLKELGN